MSMPDPSEPKGKSPDRRKLISVVHADMVGYSRLIGLDDVGTLERLRTLRSTLIDPTIAEHGGRIVNTGGDSLLVVFDSIDGAVRCAVRIQQQVPDYDRDQPRGRLTRLGAMSEEYAQPLDRAICFRIGVNIGDVIPDGTDIHGDAINVAARLQAECPPGGVCVTRAVRDHVQDRLDFAFEGLGALNLKNIARPVEAFVIRPVVAATTPKSVERSLLHGIGEALPLPDRPSIAVLAFTNMGGDPEQEFFSDGIAVDIITELSRSRSLFVIARNSSFIYKGHAIDIKQVARELGVRYVVEGSIRRVAEQTRITVQLIDALANTHIWAELYDRGVEHVFSVQREIAEAVAGAIRRRAIGKPPSSLARIIRSRRLSLHGHESRSACG